MPPSSQFKRQKLQEYITSPEAFATCLLMILIDHTGPEVFEWEPATVRLEIIDAYGVAISDDNLDKLLALMTALSTDQFYVTPLVFSSVCQALNDNEPGLDEFNPPEAEDLAWGVTEVMLNDVDATNPDVQQSFTPEVAAYAGFILSECGVNVPPAVLDWVTLPKGPLDLENSDMFDEDVETYQSVYNTQHKRKADVESYVQNQLKAMMSDIKMIMELLDIKGDSK